MKIARVNPPHHPEMDPLTLPAYQTAGAAGMDLCADVGASGLFIGPGGRKVVPTGFVFEIPDGFEGQVRPRSGLASKQGVTIINTPGTLDSDYRGELKVALVNLGDKGYTIGRGERIAQLVIAPVLRVLNLVEVPVESLTSTERGSGGFGSTGTGERCNHQDAYGSLVMDGQCMTCHEAPKNSE